jgi:dihydropyrimidine dehydrogenase (NAD+) subunit PreT
MAEFKPPTTKEEYNKNFKQLKPLMNATEAYYESSRCLFCYDAPCVNACPTEIDIPLFIRQINSANVDGAAKTIFASNYFGNACGKVCPTEVLCEGACVYNHQDVKPIEIGRLQSYATSKAIEKNITFFKPGISNGKKVAIIGAGPAGISCACELRVQGFDVDIYETKGQPSGLTVHGVAPYKIENHTVLNEMKYLQQQLGFNILYNKPIINPGDVFDLESRYDAIFIGVGLGHTAKLRINGEELENCLGAVEFVEQLRSNQHKMKVPDKVIVLGGGNTAMDAASECARMGAKEVILAYRRSKEEMGAYDFEYDLAKGVGVKGVFNVTPAEIIGDDKVNGVRFIYNGSDPSAAKEFTVNCNWVIKATGQSKHAELYRLIKDLQIDEKGRVVINATYQTSNKKYFAAGDAVSGGQEVVNAVADGKKAAFGIGAFLVGER